MTKKEKEFIEAKRLPFSLFPDAKKRSIRGAVAEQMKREGKLFAYNATPCIKFGHTLRTRSNHCIQCDNARISYMMRNVEYGMVYIAGSTAAGLLKIGTSKSPSERVSSLASRGYADQYDWRLLLSISCPSAGKVEFEAHKRLNRFRITDFVYYHDGADQTASEIFNCSYQLAKDALMESVKSLNLKIDDLKEYKIIS